MKTSQTYRLSAVGQRMSQLTGVRAIMKDIAEALRSPTGRDFCDLSAGNPLLLPDVVALWREVTREVTESDAFGPIVARYGMTQGYAPLIEAVVKDFNSRYGLSLTEKNVLITPGSQSLYFFAANCFGGKAEDGSLRHVVLPVCPDYTGYGGVSLQPEAVISYRPTLDMPAAHRFKYRPNLDALQIDGSTGCIIFSRPCNPTGNVMTDAEVSQIASKARSHNVPVFIDSAYGPPFPALNFTHLQPVFGNNVVHCMSLSKAGLPGERVGIAIGDPEILHALECFESNAVIHSPRLGQAIVAHAIRSGALAHLSESVIRPTYAKKFGLLEAEFFRSLPDALPWHLHLGEGSIFAWMWFDNLPISDWELYNRLKAAGVVVVPGSPFFPGLQEPWAHSSQCIRISLTASDEAIAKGVERIAKVVTETYSGNS